MLKKLLLPDPNQTPSETLAPSTNKKSKKQKNAPKKNSNPNQATHQTPSLDPTPLAAPDPSKLEPLKNPKVTFQTNKNLVNPNPILLAVQDQSMVLPLSKKDWKLKKEPKIG